MACVSHECLLQVRSDQQKESYLVRNSNMPERWLHSKVHIKSSIAGLTSSGPVSSLSAPTLLLPSGLQMDVNEGFGEVQTPIHHSTVAVVICISSDH